VTLTDAGTVLLGHVDAVADRLAAARQDLADLACGDAGTLRVGAFQSAVASILPGVLRRYGSAWPNVRVELEEATGDQVVLDAVRTGELDFAFGMLPLDEQALAHRELVRDEFVLVSRSGDGRIGSLAELAGRPLIVYRTCRTAAPLLAHVEAHAGPPNVVFRSDDNAAIKELVRSGLGDAILPELWTRLGGNDGLTLTPLAGLVPPRRVVLAWRRDRELTPAQVDFVETAAAACAPRGLRRAS
jgi:DNA-binding transcriptional LysR family regulator